MTGALLRVPCSTPVSPPAWQEIVGVPGGSWASVNINAVYYNGHTYIGYIAADGSARIASYNNSTHAVTISPAIVSGLVADDHNAPGVLVRQSDHKILLAVAPHDTAQVYVALSSNAEDVTAWGAATNISGSLGAGTKLTYCTLHQLSSESGKIYLFYRDGLASATGNLVYSTSTDGGSTWATQTVLFSGGANRGTYHNIDSDSTSRIDFAVTDGNISDDTSPVSLYHFYYTGGSFYKSDGTLIGASPPLGPSNVTKIHDGTASGDLNSTVQVAKKGSNVYAVYSAANTGGFAGNPMNLWYAILSSGSWAKSIITDTGINGTDRGICLSRDTPDTKVFLGRVTSGSSRMWLYQTSNGGSTWASSDLTGVEVDPTQLNTGPISPLNAQTSLEAVWIYGSFNPNYFQCTRLRGFPDWQIT